MRPPYSEEEIQDFERKIPDLFAFAVNQAFLVAKKEGLSLVVSSDSENGIFEILPNGARRFIKKLDPPLRVPIGTIVHFS